MAGGGGPRHYNRVFALIRSELAKQGGICHRRVIRLRLYTYYAVLYDIEGLWIETNTVLNEARRRGDLSVMDESWFVLPDRLDPKGILPPPLAALYQEKRDAFQAWDNAERRIPQMLAKHKPA